MPKERPILFSTDMIRSILDGRKTQTRRVMKPQPDQGVSGLIRRITSAGNWLWGNRLGNMIEMASRKCPYGQPGDLLWVREAHVFLSDEFQIRAGVAYRDSKSVTWLKDTSVIDGKTVYNVENPDCWKWRPSIFMPRWASRITLRVNDVRVERVQDINERDCVREGCAIQTKLPDETEYTFRGGFRNLWDSINAKRGYSWESNPWVWVVEFERID